MLPAGHATTRLPLRRALAAGLTAVLGAVLSAPAHPGRGEPLWPGARYASEERQRAILRGLQYIDSVARDPRYFADYGHDMLSAFANIAATSADRQIRDLAWRMGHERAMEWRRLNPHVRAGAESSEVSTLVFGMEAAERLGAPAPPLRSELRRAAARYSAEDYYGFDPVREPPPSDLPRRCACGQANRRGVRVCSRCGKALRMYGRYDLWQDALIGTYTGDQAGIPLGAHWADAIRWLPAMRPYRGRENGRNRDFYDSIYGATHVVYTINHYSVTRVSPACLPDEFAFLRANLRQAVAEHDPETMGEYLDTLRAFGLTLDDPLVRTGIEFLLSTQNPDGSWDDLHDPAIYAHYHPTWTAIDGLREYRWGGLAPCPPGAMPGR